MEYTLHPRQEPRWLMPALATFLLLAGVIAYSNSLRGPFIFDDIGSIVENESIRSFSTALHPPSGGETVSGRPVLNLSLAINWLVHPLQTESVTYIVQRAESLAGLFYLLTLYCVIRGSQSARKLGWYT